MYFHMSICVSLENVGRGRVLASSKNAPRKAKIGKKSSKQRSFDNQYLRGRKKTIGLV